MENSVISQKTPSWSGAVEITRNDNYFISDWIRVLPGATYKISGVSESGYVEWNTNYSKSTMVTITTSQATSYSNNVEFTVPTKYIHYSNNQEHAATYVYMRFHALKSDKDNITLEMVDSQAYTGNNTFVLPNNATLNVIAIPNEGYVANISKTSGIGTFTTTEDGRNTIATLSRIAGVETTSEIALNWVTDSFALTINPNGGTFNGTTANTVVTQSYGTTYSVANNPTKEGYVFNGWILENGSKGSYYEFDSSIEPVEQRVMKFDSESCTMPNTYNNLGNGNVSLQMVEDNTAEGGWSCNVVTNGDATPNAGGITFFAYLNGKKINVVEIKAKIPLGYRIVVNGVGQKYTGVGSSYTIIGENGEYGTGDWQTYRIVYYGGDAGNFMAFKYLSLSGTNNKSVSWYIDSITEKVYTKESFKSVYTFGKGNATLVAQWSIGGAKVLFNKNGGTFNSTYVDNWVNNYVSVSGEYACRCYIYNHKYNVFPNDNSYDWTPDNRVISKEGYDFEGWYTEQTDGTKVFNSDGTLIPSVEGYSDSSGRWIKCDDNVTLYAHWSNDCVVTYNYNLEKNYIDLVSEEVRCTYFTGGENDCYDLGKIYADGLSEGDILKISFDVQSYGKVESIEGHTAMLSFRAEGNQTGESPALILGKFVEHENTEYNYTIMTDPLTQAQLQNDYFDAIVRLDYLKYILHDNIKIYNIKVERISKQDIKVYGEEIGTLPEPEVSGYQFNGWYTEPVGGVRVTSETVLPTNDVTYYAHWTKKTYTVTYNGNGSDGGTTASSTFTYDQEENLAENGFTKAGYKFAGWSTVQTTTCTMITEDTGTYSYQVDADEQDYTNIHEYSIAPPFYEGDVYQVEVETKKSSGQTHVYFYGANGYLAVAKSANSQGELKHGIDGDNYIWSSEDYKKFTVTYTLSGTGNGSVVKNVLFRAYPGSEGSIRNVRIYKFSSGSPIYMDKESVKNLTTNGNITLYAVWKQE